MTIYAACTMCKDEIHNVAKWLERTKDFDRRVVLDTGSTDGTLELLKESDVKLDKWVPDHFRFDVVRNAVAMRVPKVVDWLFWPDMDEEYEDNWREEMDKILADTPKVTRVLHKSIHYKNGVCTGEGTESGTGVDSKIFKNMHYQWIKPIHEHPIPIKGVEEVIVSTDRIIRHHYHYDRQWVDDLCYDIARKAVVDDPTDDWSMFFALQDSYKRREVENILFYGNMYLDITRPYTDFRSLAHMYIGLAQFQKFGNVTEDALISMLRAVAENPYNEEARKMYAQACENRPLSREEAAKKMGIG